VRPQRQGDLDGLCGLYAVVNAIELTGVIGPKSLFHQRLFKRLIEGLSEGELRRAMTKGLTHGQMLFIADRAFRSLHRRYGVRLLIEPLDDIWSPDDLTGYLATVANLSQHVRTAVIVNLIMPSVNHWTVVYGCDRDHLRLRDSGRLRTLPLHRFALRASSWRFGARYTLVIRRVGGPPRVRAVELS
jgi:hypothetical protein